MTKSIKVWLLEADLASFQTRSSKRRLQEIVQRLFESLEEEHFVALLSDFCVGERETCNNDPRVTDVSIDSQFAGSLDVEFSGSSYFGCRDMDREHEHEAIVTFEVSLEDACIQFSTDPPDPSERYPDDEL